MRWIPIGIFALSAFLIFWTYVGYPIFIALLARWRPRPHRREPLELPVTLIVPAYNEEAVIAAKLENLLALEYPAALREIIVVADGSTDRTVEIVAGYAGKGVQLLYQPERQGKIAAMNRAVPQAHGDILIFSDANAMMEPDALQQILPNFADPQVACVSGEKRIRPAAEVQAEGESAYWRYEAFMKRADSLVNTAIGAVGEFFAIRRELYRPLETDNLIEDFVLAMRLVMDGWRVVYEPAAVTWEEASPSLGGEWRRRARMAAGGFQAIGRLRGLLSPRYGLTAFQYVSHKVLRWLAPFFMLAALISSAFLTAEPLFRLLFWGQVLFYVLAALGWVLELLGWKCKSLRLIFYFCFANATMLGGFVRYVTRSQSVLWTKAR
ncbi:MAG TPA: glycosyltransferase family 2 protein [Anaerolineae bacterium]|nr:glycosyltransferase family 2 protein [Anaerolineae bacterium]